jgi:hypothetical protein
MLPHDKRWCPTPAERPVGTLYHRNKTILLERSQEHPRAWRTGDQEVQGRTVPRTKTRPPAIASVAKLTKDDPDRSAVNAILTTIALMRARSQDCLEARNEQPSVEQLKLLERAVRLGRVSWLPQSLLVV